MLYKQANRPANHLAVQCQRHPSAKMMIFIFCVGTSAHHSRRDWILKNKNLREAVSGDPGVTRRRLPSPLLPPVGVCERRADGHVPHGGEDGAAPAQVAQRGQTEVVVGGRPR